MIMLLAVVMKTSIVLLIGLGLTSVLRNKPAALRHWMLAVTLVCVAVMPAMEAIAPSWHVSVPERWSERGAGQASRADRLQAVPTTSAPSDVSVALDAKAIASDTRLPVRSIVIAAWLTGVGISLVALVVGGVTLARIASRSRKMSDAKWLEIAQDIERTYGLRRRVALLQTSDRRLLVTWGVFRPKLIVPASASGWDEDRMRLVLLHELAHVRRADWATQLGAELLRAIYWFNPLVWLACARLRRESELACDNAVLAHGIDGAIYATHLVDIARDLRPVPMWTAAPAMARASSLERRIKAMLDHRVNRSSASRVARAAAFAAILACSTAVAGFATAQAFSRLAGSLVDPTTAALPGATVILTNVNTAAKYEVQSDRTGRYEFIALPAGEYLLETRLPGFASYQGRLTIAGGDVERNLTLQLGTIEETIIIIGAPAGQDPPPPPPPPPPDPEKQRLLEEKRQRRAAQQCPGPVVNDGMAIGGNIRVPMKLKDVKPRYPQSLRSSGIEGTVVLRARIGADGAVRDIRVLSSAHPDLAGAASEAVRQWEFDPTLLNCVAVEVDMNVTARFHYRP